MKPREKNYQSRGASAQIRVVVEGTTFVEKAVEIGLSTMPFLQLWQD